jgi:hypothetical protein
MPLSEVEIRSWLRRQDGADQPEKGHEDSDDAEKAVPFLEGQPTHGKEANQIEAEQDRPDQPFPPINCLELLLEVERSDEMRLPIRTSLRSMHACLG